MAVEISYYGVRVDSLSQYRECTTTPGSSTVMNATFSSSHTEMLFTFRPSLTKTELPCLLYGLASYQESLALLGL